MLRMETRLNGDEARTPEVRKVLEGRKHAMCFLVNLMCFRLMSSATLAGG